MKLSKLHLFLIIIVVIVLSTLGFSVKEYFESGGAGDAEVAMEREKERRTDEQPGNAALEGGSSYDPFTNADTFDPLSDNDYSKTIAGLEDIVVPGRGRGRRHHHDENGNHYPGAHGGEERRERRRERREERRENRAEKELEKADRKAAQAAGVDMSKYILKSEIVPPVCPKCPDSRTCPRPTPPPPCPPCARCPEPAFECKKVPNYSAINAANAGNILPMPRLNSFAQFN